MAGIVERSQTLKREDLSNLLTVVDAKSTGFMSTVKTGDAPRNSLLEWGVDKHKDNLVQTATYTSGVSNNLPIDGVDTTSTDFENYDARERCRVYIQMMRRFPKVSRLADMTSDVAGVGYKQEMARSIVKALEAHARDIEATLLSAQETNAETSSAPYQTRGVGKWISSSAQGTEPVPSSFRTPSTSIKTGVSASNAQEEDIRGILQSIYEQTGETNKTFYGICGSEMKRVISEFSLFSPRTDNVVVSNRDTDDNVLANAVDIIEGDFGTVTLTLSSFLLADARSGSNFDPSKGKKTLFILNLEQFELAFAEKTNVRELPDLGGGERQLIESVFALKSYSGGLDHGMYQLS